jgi:hypothetical protein
MKDLSLLTLAVWGRLIYSTPAFWSLTSPSRVYLGVAIGMCERFLLNFSARVEAYFAFRFNVSA